MPIISTFQGTGRFFVISCEKSFSPISSFISTFLDYCKKSFYADNINISRKIVFLRSLVEKSCFLKRTFFKDHFEEIVFAIISVNVNISRKRTFFFVKNRLFLKSAPFISTFRKKQMTFF